MPESGAYCGDYICSFDIDNWPSGSTYDDWKAIIDKVEQIIDKVCHTHFGPEAFDIEINGNNKNRLFVPLKQDIISVTRVEINCVELDPSWYTWDKYSIYLDPCIGDSMWGKNAMEDGDFYIWKTAAPTTDLYYWIETIAGTSTVNRDSVQVQIGNYCVRLDIDAVPSQAGIEQHFSLLRNRSYRLAFKYMNSAAAKHAEFLLYNSIRNESLKLDGTWTAGMVYVQLPNSTAWTDFSLDFTSHTDFVGYVLYLGNWAAASSSIYFDNVGILTAGIAAIAADISEGLFPRGYNNVRIVGTKGEAGTVPEAIKQAAVVLGKYENDPTLFSSSEYKSEKIGDYSYTKTDTITEAEWLTGVKEADFFLKFYIKRKPIIMAP